MNSTDSDMTANNSDTTIPAKYELLNGCQQIILSLQIFLTVECL